jgi:DNA-binding response OmpR family regulator
MRILVVDDEKPLVKGVRFNLERDGYMVDTCHDGAEGVALAKEHRYDLVILDLMMPGVDGLEACRRIREFSSVPVIMLTAKGEDMDKLIGFEYGADDYVTKPFNILELKARIRAVLRRGSAQAEPEGELLRRGGITLDPAARTVTANGQRRELTAKEFDLLELMMRNPGRVYSRESLLNIVWGFEFPGDIRTVDVHIRRLREKLEENPARPEHILTKWSVGYYFSAQPHTDK